MTNSSISLLETSMEKRVKVLEKLGYAVDKDGYIINSNTSKQLICIYSEEPVHIDFAAILPGSTLIINANPLTMSQYFVEHGS